MRPYADRLPFALDYMMHGSTSPENLPLSVRSLLTLATPVVVSRLGIMAMGLVDAIVVGQYSSTQLGYQALGWAPARTA